MSRPVAHGRRGKRRRPRSKGGELKVDVRCEVAIARPRGVVAAYSSNPANARAWYSNIKSVEWQTPPPLAVGSRLCFTAVFLGKHLTYTYEVVDLIHGSRLVMRTAEGPFPMETGYSWESMGDRATRMVLRNRGEPRGFSGLLAPLMAFAMRRAMQKDLGRLKALLEGAGGAALQTNDDGQGAVV